MEESEEPKTVRCPPWSCVITFQQYSGKPGLRDPRCAVSVGIVGLARNHNRSLVPTAARHIASFLAANNLCEVLLAAEQYLDILVHTTTAVEAGVDYDTVAVVVLTQDVGIYRTETTVGHRLDVDITQAATRQALHVGSTLLLELHPLGQGPAGQHRFPR